MLNNMINHNKKLRKFIVLLLIGIIGIALVYACGSEEDEQFSGNFLEISLSCPDLEEARELSRAFDERELSDIETLILTVDQGQPPINPITEEFDADEDQIMIDVVIGTGRVFTIQGVDAFGNVICTGQEETDITVDTVNVDIPCEFVCENCADGCIDGIDNDFDELIDCEDPDCEDFCMEPGDDDDDIPVGDDDDDTPTEPEICDDGIDNDGDTFVDCADQDCGRFPDCFISPTPPPSSIPPECIEAPCFDSKCCAFCINPCKVAGGDNSCSINCDYEMPQFCSNPE